jgi:hypothetical protein
MRWCKYYWPHHIETWRKQLWKWDLALKVKLFFWLALDSKISHGTPYRKGDGVGRASCPLCFKEEETITHIFIFCSFTIKMWQNLHIVFKFSKMWGGTSLTSSFEDWVKMEKCFKSLPILVCWQVWLERNLSIF